MSGTVAPDWRDIFCGRTAQLAAFVQRAYFEADRVIDDPERWPTLSHDEQMAALGLRATLGETAPDADDRRMAEAEQRLMERLGDQWEAGGALFRSQLQLMRSQLEEAEGAEP